MPIIWQMPDGSLQVTRLAQTPVPGPGETVSDAVMRLARVVQAKTPSLAGGIPTLVTTAGIPTSRLHRNKWRLQGTVVVPDLTLPDPPHPKQARMDEINSATTVADLKRILVDAVRNGF